MTSQQQTPTPAGSPPAPLPTSMPTVSTPGMTAGGDFVVTITHTVQVRVPDVAALGAALDLPPFEALIEIADTLGVAGQHLDKLDTLPAGAYEVVRTDRVDTDVDRLETFEFTDGTAWRMHVPARDGDRVGRSTTFVVTDQPLTEKQALAIRDKIRDASFDVLTMPMQANR